MPQKPKILKRQIVAQSRIFRVEELELEFSNGQHRRYERLLGGSRGSVLVSGHRRRSPRVLARAAAR